MKKVIDIRNLDFHYPSQKELLAGVNLQLKTGSVYGLLGKNGEGKSTLLRLISGLLFPKKGKAGVLGYEAGTRNPDMLESIFYLPEEILDSSLNIQAFEAVYAPFYPDFSSSTYFRILQDFMIDIQSKSINELSYGQKKKFFIAFGLATNAKIILLDEPTNGLDIPSKKQFRNIIAEVANEKNCIIISTHQVLDVENIIDNIIIMDNHAIVLNERIKNITDRLLFTTSDKREVDDTIVYSEETLQGFSYIKENTSHAESRLNIELLFNAVTSSQKVKDLLNPPTY